MEDVVQRMMEGGLGCMLQFIVGDVGIIAIISSVHVGVYVRAYVTPGANLTLPTNYRV